MLKRYYESLRTGNFGWATNLGSDGRPIQNPAFQIRLKIRIRRHVFSIGFSTSPRGEPTDVSLGTGRITNLFVNILGFSIHSYVVNEAGFIPRIDVWTGKQPEVAKFRTESKLEG